MDSNSKVFVAGHKGLVGSAILRNLQSRGYKNLITANKDDYDLRHTSTVNNLFSDAKPEYVFLAAAKVGGIGGNSTYPADYIYDNLMIQSNVIDAAYRSGVKKLLFLGSSCIYPKFPKIPITEDQLMTSPLEESNSAYAIAKIAGMRMCQAYRQQFGFKAISLMPTNLYGPNDNFDLENSHVLPALLRKCHEGKFNIGHDLGGGYQYPITLWGDGSPKREFLHVDDLAEACYVCMQKYDDEQHINVGTGEDISIKELVEKISNIVGFTGGYKWNTNVSNGTPRKVLNIDKIKTLGWEPKISLNKGIESTYEWYKKSISS